MIESVFPDPIGAVPQGSNGPESVHRQLITTIREIRRRMRLLYPRTAAFLRPPRRSPDTAKPLLATPKAQVPPAWFHNGRARKRLTPARPDDFSIEVHRLHELVRRPSLSLSYANGDFGVYLKPLTHYVTQVIGEGLEPLTSNGGTVNQPTAHRPRSSTDEPRNGESTELQCASSSPWAVFSSSPTHGPLRFSTWRSPGGSAVAFISSPSGSLPFTGHGSPHTRSSL
jgi:hypothetical protein